MHNVRRMVVADLSWVFPLVERCYRESRCAGKPEQFAFVTAWQRAFNLEIGLGFVAERDGFYDGFNIGSITPDMITGDIVAQELVIYVVPEARSLGLGGKMFEAFSAEAKKAGAARLFSGYVEGYNESVTVPMLSRRGFRPQEHWWVKEI